MVVISGLSGKVKSSFIAMPLIIGHFKSSSSYRAFVYDQVGYAKELEQIKHLALEEV